MFLKRYFRVKVQLYLLLYVLDSNLISSTEYYVNWPEDKNQAFPSRTSPIEIFSSEAKYVKTDRPLTFLADYNEKNILINTGKTASVHLKYSSESHITGGILYRDIYIYKKCRFFWNNDIQGDTRLRIDGEGTPLEVQMVFYNNKYNNFTEALNNADGLVVLSFLIDIGPEENLDFNDFENHMKKIKTTGSKVDIISGSVFGWFDEYFERSHYFAYPGDYEGCGCATSIVCVTRHNRPYISEKQFRVFQNLKNVDGEPLENLEQPHARHGRPLIYANTTQEILLF